MFMDIIILLTNTCLCRKIVKTWTRKNTITSLVVISEVGDLESVRSKKSLTLSVKVYLFVNRPETNIVKYYHLLNLGGDYLGA